MIVRVSDKLLYCSSEAAPPASPEPCDERPGSIWCVFNCEGIDIAYEYRYSAMEQASIMAGDFPDMGPWRVYEYRLPSPVAEKPERTAAPAPAGPDVDADIAWLILLGSGADVGDTDRALGIAARIAELAQERDKAEWAFHEAKADATKAEAAAAEWESAFCDMRDAREEYRVAAAASAEDAARLAETLPITEIAVFAVNEWTAARLAAKLIAARIRDAAVAQEPR